MKSGMWLLMDQSNIIRDFLLKWLGKQSDWGCFRKAGEPWRRMKESWCKVLLRRQVNKYMVFCCANAEIFICMQ